MMKGGVSLIRFLEREWLRMVKCVWKLSQKGRKAEGPREGAVSRRHSPKEGPEITITAKCIVPFPAWEPFSEHYSCTCYSY